MPSCETRSDTASCIEHTECTALGGDTDCNFIQSLCLQAEHAPNMSLKTVAEIESR